MVNAIIILFTCLFNLALGGLVFARNPKSNASKAFLGITFFVCAWSVCNYLTGLTSIDLAWNGIFNDLSFVTAALILICAVWFTHNFPLDRAMGKRWAALLLGFTLLALLSATPEVAGRVTRSGGQLVFSTGSLLGVYILGILVMLSIVIVNLLTSYRRSRGRERQQTVYILFAFGVPTILVLLTNAVLPLFTSSWQSAAIGPPLTMLLVGGVTFAIVKHHLFDLRLVVARALGYTLSITAVVALYVSAGFVLLNQLANVHLAFSQELLLAVVSGVTALLFQPVKRFFDRISNRFFYQDAYDPQALLNTLNKTLVTTADLEKMLNEVLSTITASLRAEFSMIILMDRRSSPPVRVFGTMSKHFRAADMKSFHSPEFLARPLPAIIITDDLGYEDIHLRSLLTKNSVAVLAQLDQQIAGETIKLGHLLIGFKKSGSPYNAQDIRVIETITNELVIAVQNALRFEEIERFNETLQEKIDDATRKLRRTNDKLRKLDETKDDFISMASHQLRTPLTSVKGYVSMVLDGDGGELTPMQRKLLNQSFISAQRMVYLISDLLNVSRLRTGKFIIETSPVNLAQVVKDEVEQLLETARSRGIKIAFDKPEHFPLLMLDDTKMRQVIMNFLDNAIYYTQRGGKIEVALQDKPHSVEFTVTDTGIGVPRHEQPHLFTKFYRANNAKRARPDGTGLGLFMAKKVIIAQGGALIFKSVEGKGSTFGFTFAKEKLQPVPQQSGHAGSGS